MYYHFKKFSEFNNIYLCNFEIDKNKFVSIHQYLLFEKAKLFSDESIQQRILNQDYVNLEFGKKLKWDKIEDLMNKWNDIKDDVAKKGIREKFNQNADLKKKLMNTRNSIIIGLIYDKYWGIGLSKDDNYEDENEWLGQNVLGKLLMEVRDEFKSLPKSEHTIYNDFVKPSIFKKQK